MQSSPQAASTPLTGFAGEAPPSRRSEDLAYQILTVTAILLVLVSLWVF